VSTGFNIRLVSRCSIEAWFDQHSSDFAISRRLRPRAASLLFASPLPPDAVLWVTMPQALMFRRRTRHYLA
jgi:hypothetical protein